MGGYKRGRVEGGFKMSHLKISKYNHQLNYKTLSFFAQSLSYPFMIQEYRIKEPTNPAHAVLQT